ncbi:MAG: right-handed parallel beta-helix repeat-containing protein [Clostridia bacterium]|nr:right-handed parallel beta-helix repeat-containing protein [Clostridia bacterium]
MKKSRQKKIISEIICLFIGIIFSIVGLYYFHMQYLCYEYTPLQFILAVVVCFGGALLSIPLSRNAGKKKTVINAVITALVFAIVLIGLMLLTNAVIGNGELNQIALIIPVYLSFIMITVLAFLCVFRIFDKKILKAILSALILTGFVIGSYSYIVPFVIDEIYDGYKAPIPALSTYTNMKADDKVINGDFYVSTRGNDSNSGAKDAPFRTIEKAVEAVRNTDKTNKNGITVCIEGGEYRVSALEFTKEDSGTADCPITYCAIGGEVILNGGVTLSPDDFKSVGEYPEISDRLTPEARENVVVVNLTEAPYSLSKDDWGKIYAIGSYHTAASYDGDYTGELYCELFVNDKRQTLARYPDAEFLYTEEVVKTGLGKESDGALTTVENWDEIRNPESDIYKVDSELAQRISGWKTLDDIWMFGYWKYDWADASSPIGSFDAETCELSPKFVSLYGTKTDAPYYFFNVLEELTSEGEWYLDRENGLLCLWKPENIEAAQIDLSLSLNPVINAQANYLTFDGITVKGTRSDGIVITGNNNTVQNCLIKNVAGNALIMTGSNNLAYNNEITHTGKGGIILDGGDTQTLTPGNSKAENNYIHDWSEIYQTYQPAVTLLGVGNICSHNEMANSPHEAITYKGNNHIIEYNNIHDVCLLSDDAGAIYSGRSWVWYGNIIRYNCIYNVGSGDHRPDGIYLDDALSGQQVYGNLLINIPKNSIHIGGGRDNVVTNNIIVNSGENAIYFDERARDGALNSGWFTHAHIGSGDMWDALYASPWKSEIWQNTFSEYKTMTDDISESDSAAYIPNPASIVKGNLIFNKYKIIGDIHTSAYRFSDISDNKIYSLNKAEEIFVDINSGNYNIKDIEILKNTIPGFKNIPLDKIGRTN